MIHTIICTRKTVSIYVDANDLSLTANIKLSFLIGRICFLSYKPIFELIKSGNRVEEKIAPVYAKCEWY